MRQEFRGLQRGTYLLSVQLTGGTLDLVATSMVSPNSAPSKESGIPTAGTVFSVSK